MTSKENEKIKELKNLKSITVICNDEEKELLKKILLTSEYCLFDVRRLNDQKYCLCEDCRECIEEKIKFIDEEELENE